MSARILRGDWKDVLPGRYDPERAVVITDPPYGLAAEGGIGNAAIGSHSRGRAAVDARKGYETDKGYEDTIPWAQHVQEVLDLLPAKRHVIRGPATTIIRRDHPQPRRVCVETAPYQRRAMNKPGVVPYLWQGWVVYGRLRIEHHARPPLGDAIQIMRRTKEPHVRRTAHRAMTPIDAASWIIDTWVDPGCVVIDPFAGMGTIGRAARDLGFDYLGAEIVEEYAAAAEESLAIERPSLGLETA